MKTKIQSRIDELLRQHGTLRGIQAAIGVNYSQLAKMHLGKAEGSDATLRKLGIERIVMYRSIE